MTPKQQEALEAALAALESERIMAADSAGNYTIEVTPKRILAAIEKIKAVLAEHEQKNAKKLQWHLDSEASKFLADLIMACEEPTEITLSVGFIQDESGVILHGLLVHETELPDEGSSLLVECEPIGLPPQPREWKELSEDEMHKCGKAMDAEPLAEGWPELHKYAIALSAALRAKNEVKA